MKKDNKYLLLLIFFMITMIVGFGSGYIAKTVEIEKSMGISFECNQFTTEATKRGGCSANISIPKANITIEIVSDFDKIKILD